MPQDAVPEPICAFTISFSEPDAQELMKRLDPKELLQTGCKVRKEPGCCILCAMNEDCSKIPLHVHCFPAGTLVSGPTAIASITSRYTGELVEIETRSGAVLSATPNHPILTPQGWVGAGLLNEGDYVVRESRPEGLVVGDPSDYQQPAPIEDVARSVGEGGTVVTTRVPMTSMDLHGDALDGDIAVIRSDGELWNDAKPLTDQELDQFPLGGPDRPVEESLAVLGSTTLQFEGLNLPTASTLGSGGPRPAFSGGPTGHHQPVSGGDPTVIESLDLLEDASDRGATDSIALGEGVGRLTLAVSPDEILKISRHPFDGHVYNLETRRGWYLANSIVVHNCRCKPEPYLTGLEEV